MICRRGILLVPLPGIFLACAAVGCDDRPSIPPELQEQQQTSPSTEETTPPRPTTQELVSGAYAPIRLDTFPLTLTAPSGWKLTRLGSIVMVEGFTPVDQARIQLSPRLHFTQMQLDALYTGAKKEQTADPKAQMTVDLRDIGPLKVLDRRSVGRTLNIPITDGQGIQRLDENGQPMVHRSTKMNWRLSVFVPTGGGFDQYELNFIELSKEQYDADRAFLEKILYSITLDSAEPGTTTAPAPR